MGPLATHNLKRGFFRLWIFVALLWALPGLIINAGPLGVYDLATTVGLRSQPTWELIDREGKKYTVTAPDAESAYEKAIGPLPPRTSEQLEALADARRRRSSAEAAERQNALLILFGPPVALLLLGYAVGWVFRGFRQRKA